MSAIDNVVPFPPARRAHGAGGLRMPAAPEAARRACLAVAIAAAAAAGVRVTEVFSPGPGRRSVAAARQIAMYIACVDLELPQRVVGRIFGRASQTVGDAVRAVEDRRDDPAFDAALTRLEEEVANGGAP